MRIVFFGTADFAVPSLRGLVAAGRDVSLVFTRAPAPAGRRGLAIRRSPIHEAAEELGIEILTPPTLRDEATFGILRSQNADLGVVVAYGLLLPRQVFESPRQGCLNVHGSLLPRWRGAAPVERAILADDEETGVSIMKLDAGLDTGPVADQLRIAITPDMTAGDLRGRLAELGAKALIEAIARIERGTIVFRPQSATLATYAPIIEKSESEIDWARPASAVRRQIHAFSPFPGAHSTLAIRNSSDRVKLLRCEETNGSGIPGEILDDRLTVACGVGAVRIIEIQRAGRKIMSGDEFMRGTSVNRGARFQAVP